MKVFYDSAQASTIEFTLRQSIEPLNEIIEKFNTLPLNNIESMADIETLRKSGLLALAYDKIKDRKFAGVDLDPDKVLNVLGIAGALGILQKSYSEYAHLGLGYIDCLDFKNGKLSVNEKALKARIENDCYMHLTAEQAKAYEVYLKYIESLNVIMQMRHRKDYPATYIHPNDLARFHATGGDIGKEKFVPSREFFKLMINK